MTKALPGEFIKDLPVEGVIVLPDSYCVCIGVSSTGAHYKPVLFTTVPAAEEYLTRGSLMAMVATYFAVWSPDNLHNMAQAVYALPIPAAEVDAGRIVRALRQIENVAYLAVQGEGLRSKILTVLMGLEQARKLELSIFTIYEDIEEGHDTLEVEAEIVAKRIHGRRDSSDAGLWGDHTWWRSVPGGNEIGPGTEDAGRQLPDQERDEHRQPEQLAARIQAAEEVRRMNSHDQENVSERGRGVESLRLPDGKAEGRGAGKAPKQRALPRMRKNRTSGKKQR